MVFHLRRRSYYTYAQDRGRRSGLRSLFFSLPVSRVTFLLISACCLSLGSLILALSRYSSTSSRITFQLESWTEPTYDPFVRPPAADALADATIRPIKAHLQIPDACLDTWISSGRWRGSCIRVPVEESPIDLVYIWVNGSYVCNSRAGRALTFCFTPAMYIIRSCGTTCLYLCNIRRQMPAFASTMSSAILCVLRSRIRNRGSTVSGTL